ncbi:MAG: hypothetical protein M3Z11_11335 [Candidatus Dormibacteraeota bacterium]|nr:hypothetical protein [Candidatus Dormibacteraeota bacterium]
MDQTTLMVIAAVVVLIVAIALISMIVRRGRSQRLKSRFGPEYDRTVQATGNRGKAERELESRQKRREQLDIRPLDPGLRDRYAREWMQVQADFVDAPSDAVRRADQLVTQVMRERGYPTDNFEQRSSDVSVDHPRVVDEYRAAQKISMANRENRASTEDLRQAMRHYRSLFDDLLGKTEITDQSESTAGRRERPRREGGQ